MVVKKSMKEYILKINEFGKTDTHEDIYAFIYMAFKLLILEPSSYINHPEMGIGIQNYIHESMDNATLTELETIINKQFNEYIPNTYIEGVAVRTSDVDNKLLEIYIETAGYEKNKVKFDFSALPNGKLKHQIYIGS